jgi:hypothetical protein
MLHASAALHTTECLKRHGLCHIFAAYQPKIFIAAERRYLGEFAPLQKNREWT